MSPVCSLYAQDLEQAYPCPWAWEVCQSVTNSQNSVHTHSAPGQPTLNETGHVTIKGASHTECL